MTEPERARIVRVLGARNQLRIASIQGDDNSDSGTGAQKLSD